jgi:hypothetical protein
MKIMATAAILLCIAGCGPSAQQTALEQLVAAPTFESPKTQVDTICEAATDCWKRVLQDEEKAVASTKDIYAPGEKRDEHLNEIRRDASQEVRTAGTKPRRISIS